MGVALSGGSAAAPWYETAGVTWAAAYQAIGAVSQAASYVNLANPGNNNAVVVSAPTWGAATGWTFDGVAQNLRAGALSDSQEAMTIIVRYANLGTHGDKARCVMGSTFLSLHANLQISPFTKNLYWYRGNNGVAGAATPAGGVMALAGTSAYFNGAYVGNTAFGGALSRNIFIGTSTQGSQFFNGDVLAAGIAMSVLTAEQVAAVSAAMAAL